MIYWQSNELYSLSSNIKELLKIDSKWTKEQAKIAKGADQK